LAIYKTRIGEFEISEGDIVEFPEGIPGFEKLRKFSILHDERTDPIKWMVSLEDPNVALPVIDPWMVRVDYMVEISEADKKFLKLEDPADALVVCIVVIPHDRPEDSTINLLAPIVINYRKRIGKQVILEKGDYSIRHRIADEMERSRRIMAEGGKTRAGVEQKGK